jgi:hypothetical protein
MMQTPVGAPYQLRPMSMGDIFDATFALYRQNFALFAGISAVLGVPQAILSAIIFVSRPSLTTTGADNTTQLDAGAALLYGGLVLVSLLVTFIFNTIISGALAQAISARYLGHPMTIEGAYQALGPRVFARLIFASLLQSVFVAIGAILLIIPGIYLYIRLLFTPQVIVLERTGIFGAFSRSGELVSGTWWRVFGISLVLGIMVGIINGLAGQVPGTLLALIPWSGAHALGAFLSALVGVFVNPIQLGALTLLYYDLRIRKEGFDLEQLALTLRPSAPAQP